MLGVAPQVGVGNVSTNFSVASILGPLLMLFLRKLLVSVRRVKTGSQEIKTGGKKGCRWVLGQN